MPVRCCRTALENRHMRADSESTVGGLWARVSHDYTNDSGFPSGNLADVLPSSREALVSVFNHCARKQSCGKSVFLFDALLFDQMANILQRVAPVADGDLTGLVDQRAGLAVRQAQQPNHRTNAFDPARAESSGLSSIFPSPLVIRTYATFAISPPPPASRPHLPQGGQESV